MTLTATINTSPSEGLFHDSNISFAYNYQLGPLDIGQKFQVKFGQRRYDAVAAESWKPKSRGMSLLFFSSPFVGICGLSKFSKTRL